MYVYQFMYTCGLVIKEKEETHESCTLPDCVVS